MEAQGRDFPVLGDAREGRFPFGESILPVFFMASGIHPVMKKTNVIILSCPRLALSLHTYEEDTFCLFGKHLSFQCGGRDYA